MQVQKMKKELLDPFEVAQMYYKILSAINGLKLSDGELQLTAFAAIKGNITLGNIREEYCEKYQTSVATINNTVHRLKRKQVIIKKDSLLIVNPVINALDFSKSVNVLVSLTKANPLEPTVATTTNDSILNVKKYG